MNFKGMKCVKCNKKEAVYGNRLSIQLLCCIYCKTDNMVLLKYKLCYKCYNNRRSYKDKEKGHGYCIKCKTSDMIPYTKYYKRKTTKTKYDKSRYTHIQIKDFYTFEEFLYDFMNDKFDNNLFTILNENEIII